MIDGAGRTVPKGLAAAPVLAFIAAEAWQAATATCSRGATAGPGRAARLAARRLSLGSRKTGAWGSGQTPSPGRRGRRLQPATDGLPAAVAGPQLWKGRRAGPAPAYAPAYSTGGCPQAAEVRTLPAGVGDLAMPGAGRPGRDRPSKCTWECPPTRPQSPQTGGPPAPTGERRYPDTGPAHNRATQRILRLWCTQLAAGGRCEGRPA